MERLSRSSLAGQIYLALVLIATPACVPSQYTSVPLPSAKRAAAGDNDNGGGPATQAGSGDTRGQSTTNPSGGANPSSGAGNTAASDVKFSPDVPERDALRKCMNLWGTVPFKEVKAAQVKAMDVSIGVGGGLLGSSTPLSGLGGLLNFGNTKDLEVTAEPRLIVVPLSISLGSNTTFELMNPRGWYCIKAAVGAKSTLNIKLHCDAKLAQADLGLSVDTKSVASATGTPALPVRVGINDGKTTGGQLGIMVDSSVSVSRVNASGSAGCSP